ncbi:uncharacterized protein LOC143215249 [Lasioglossum baleicum]|uniref:uncharacterized protein LOC143215249 n=1 Tax=Lasioglossum baleicum TaxID=434251 RepID=UPI003FCD4C02
MHAVSEVEATDHLVSPPQKLAEMINLLQELEEGKTASSGDVLTDAAEKDGKNIVIEEEIPEKDVVQESVQQAEEVKQDVVDEVVKEYEDFEPALQTAMQPVKSSADDSNGKSGPRIKLIEPLTKSIDSEVSPSEPSADETFASGDKFETDDAGMDTSSPRPSETSRKEISVETTTASKPSAETQATDTEAGKAKRSSFLKKKNKVEPCEPMHAETDIQSWAPECYSEPGTPSMCKAEVERFLADKKGLVGEMPICPACKKIQYFAVSSSFYYYSVYRDKRGRLYCDYCASKNAIKVLYKHDPSEQKFLKCARCGTLLRQKTTRSEYFKNKNDNCVKCVQMQARLHSLNKK